MTLRPTAAPSAEDTRRNRLLAAALATFVRYGYRKTSMEEVARAGGLSRQALYSHFATKEELFHATVRYALDQGLEAASARLRDGAASIEEKLCGAFDEWIGRYVGMIGADVTDLKDAADAVVAPIIVEHEERFLDGVVKAIRASGLPAAYKPAGLNARQLADTLHATARGLKHDCSTRAAFHERIELAVRALCLPLRERS